MNDVCHVGVQPVEHSNGRGTVTTPTRANDEDAGFDLYTNIAQEKILHPGETFMCPTGLRFAISKGFYGKIEARSGWAAKRDIIVPCGVVDSGYRGEVHVVLWNRGEDRVVIKPGDRVAQIVFHRLPEVRLLMVAEDVDFDPSTRGSGGYGSTGF